MLGMDKVKEDSRVLKQEKSESEGMYSSPNAGHICDECGFFDAENNFCLNTGERRDSLAALVLAVLTVSFHAIRAAISSPAKALRYE